MDTPAGRFHPKLKVSDVHSEQSHLNWDIKDLWRHSRDKQELLEEGSASTMETRWHKGTLHYIQEIERWPT